MSRLFQRRSAPDERLVQAARDAALPLSGGDDEYDELLRRIGNARFVLLGEASHGTHEFYEARARITMRLVAERGFSALAIEGDWPDAFRVNRYVRGVGNDRGATEALQGFRRFPPGCGATRRWGDSIEGVLHATGIDRLMLPLRDEPLLARALDTPLLQRAIGVIYRPDTERQSHYFHAQVARQFDTLIHFDRTRAVVPLEADAAWTEGRAAHSPEAAETFPEGL